MKRIISAITILIMICLLCSCNSTQRYIKQDNINLNYNNISAGTGCWMDNNFICSTEYNLGFDLYLIDYTNKKKIDTLSYSYNANLYNDKLYYFDNSGLSDINYKFIEYDLKNKRKKTIATIIAERIYNYFVIDEYLYVEVGDNDSLVRDIVCVTLDTNQRINVAQNIFSCGIVNGQLNYITQNDLKYSIYKYIPDDEKSDLIGEFKLNHQMVDDGLEGVNFNSKYIAFAYSDYETTESKICVYRYDKNTLTSIDVGGAINEFISYDRFGFFSVGGSIYHLNFNDNSIERIVELPSDDVTLFVGSDDEVYVLSMEFDGIRRYSVDGSYEDVELN